MNTGYIERFRLFRLRLYEARVELRTEYKVCLSFLFASLTAIGANYKLYLPNTPVPITLQVFFVLSSGLFLGRWFGGLSQIMYIFIGILGFPVFAGAKGSTVGGLNVVFGATGGYLLGFVFASLFIGYAVDRWRAMTLDKLLPVMLVSLFIIYTLGMLQLALVCNFSLNTAFVKGVLPFIPADAGKLLVAAGIGTVLLPKQRDLRLWRLRKSKH